MYKINFQKKAKNIDKCRIIHKGVLLKREKNEMEEQMYEKGVWIDQKTWCKFEIQRIFFRCGSGKPLRITKDIYPYLARKYRSTPTNIEHDIRTMVNVCWEGNKKLLDEIAGYPLEYKPTNSEFIDMLAYYLREIEEEN